MGADMAGVDDGVSRAGRGDMNLGYDLLLRCNPAAAQPAKSDAGCAMQEEALYLLRGAPEGDESYACLLSRVLAASDELIARGVYESRTEEAEAMYQEIRIWLDSLDGADLPAMTDPDGADLKLSDPIGENL